MNTFALLQEQLIAALETVDSTKFIHDVWTKENGFG